VVTETKLPALTSLTMLAIHQAAMDKLYIKMQKLELQKQNAYIPTIPIILLKSSIKNNSLLYFYLLIQNKISRISSKLFFSYFYTLTAYVDNCVHCIFWSGGGLKKIYIFVTTNIKEGFLHKKIFFCTARSTLATKGF
jgi:hypothetical protein